MLCVRVSIYTHVHEYASIVAKTIENTIMYVCVRACVLAMDGVQKGIRS